VMLLLQSQGSALELCAGAETVRCSVAGSCATELGTGRDTDLGRLASSCDGRLVPDAVLRKLPCRGEPDTKGPVAASDGPIEPGHGTVPLRRRLPTRCSGVAGPSAAANAEAAPWVLTGSSAMLAGRWSLGAAS